MKMSKIAFLNIEVFAYVLANTRNQEQLEHQWGLNVESTVTDFPKKMLFKYIDCE